VRALVRAHTLTNTLHTGGGEEVLIILLKVPQTLYVCVCVCVYTYATEAEERRMISSNVVRMYTHTRHTCHNQAEKRKMRTFSNVTPAQRKSKSLRCVRVCVCVCTRSCVRVRVRACACVIGCVRPRV